MAICPNQREGEAARAAKARPHAKHVVVTRGEQGCTIEPWSEGSGTMGTAYEVPTEPVEVCDPTGAGDTFISALAVGLCMNPDVLDACRFANSAARVSVMHPGAYAPTLDDIEKAAAS